MILHLDVSIAVVSSASIAIFYTMFGHMVAVAYTDVLQLILIIGGLVSFESDKGTHNFNNFVSFTS